MHTLSFLYAICLLVLGLLGLMSASEPGEVRALGIPGLFFGGAVLFCSFFALKEPRHGLSGAAFLVFLAFLTTAGNLAGHLTRATFDLSHPDQRIAVAIWTASLLYLAAALVTWKRLRRARAMEDLKG